MGTVETCFVIYRSVTNVSEDVHPCPRNVPLRHQRNREKLWWFGYHGNQKGWLTLTDLYPCLPSAYTSITRMTTNMVIHTTGTLQDNTVTSWSIVSSCQLIIDPAYQFDHGAASLSYRTTNDF